LSASNPQDEPRVASGGRSPRALLAAFDDRANRAWARVRELEEEASAMPPIAGGLRRLLELQRRLPELDKAGDVEGVHRVQEEVERIQAEDKRIHAEHEAAVVEAPRARRRAMLRFELPRAVAGWAFLAAVAAVNALWLGALGVDYIGLYLQEGFQVALLFGVLTVAIDLDRYPELIAAQPVIYVAAILSLCSEIFAVLGGVFEPPRSERELIDEGLDFVTYRLRLRTLDLLFNLIIGWVLFAAIVAWALLVAPLQYWVNLICGAPARQVLASSGTLWVVRRPHRIEFLFGHRDPSDYEKSELKKEGEQGEMSEVSFAKKPVAFTQGITAVFLFGISFLVS
jgi:hypothetical protein